MNTPLHLASYCTYPRVSLPSIEKIEKGIQVINTLLDQDMLCQHDIIDLSQAYQMVDQLEIEADSIPEENSERVLYKIAEKIKEIHQDSSAKQLITAYYLQQFKVPFINKIFAPRFNSFNLTEEKIKEIATYLPFCGKKSDFEADVQALLGNELTADVTALVQAKTDYICKREEIEKRLPNLQRLKNQDASLYPPYLEEILQGGFFHLYDHLIHMKQLSTQSEREIEEKNISFSTFSHIILEFKKAVLAQTEALIPQGNQTLFILGDTGSGKSTTLCYLRKDPMGLQGDNYQSSAPNGDIIGNDGTASCTLFPNIVVGSDLTFVDFPGFNDTHGKVISFAIELTLRALAKKYRPKILIVSSITDTEGRFQHALRLGQRLKRVLGTLDHCILGLTKYSKDPDFNGIKNIEDQQRKELFYPNKEENELEGSIKTLLSLVETIPSVQSTLDQKKEELLKLQQKREFLKLQKLPDTEAKNKHVQDLQTREISFKDSLGIKQIIRLADLTDQEHLEQTLARLNMQEKIPSLSGYHSLDSDHRDFLEKHFKEKLVTLIASRESKKISSSNSEILSKDSFLDSVKTLEKNILETSLINTLLDKSHPEIGQFFHLEEMDPAIVRKFDKEVIDGCIQDYISEITTELIIDQQVIEKLTEFDKAIGVQLANLKKDVLILSTGFLEHADEAKVKQAWETLHKEHQQRLDNRKQDLALSGFMTVTLLLALGIPYGIFKLFRKITLEQLHLKSIKKIADDLCQKIESGSQAIRRLQEIQKTVKDQGRFDEVFAHNPLMLDSTSHFKESLDQQIDQIKKIYGETEWNGKVAVLIGEIKAKFPLKEESILYALMSQEAPLEELPPYLNEPTFLALLYAFSTSQSSYQDSLKQLVPGWQPGYFQKLELDNSHEFFYAPRIKKYEYEKLKTQGRELFEQYDKTPVRRLLLVDATNKIMKEFSFANRDETRSVLNLSLAKDRKRIIKEISSNAWILEHGKEWIRQDKEFILEAVGQKEEALRFATTSLRDDRDFILKVLEKNGLALQFVDETFKNDPTIVLTAVRKNRGALQFASETLRNNFDFILDVVKQDGIALTIVDDKFKKEFNIVLTAVNQNPGVLQYVDEELNNNSNFILDAVSQNAGTFKFANERLKNNPNFILDAVRKNGIVLKLVGEKFQSDRDIVLAAVQKNGEALEFAGKELKNDRDVVLAAVGQNGLALEFASEKLRTDTGVLTAALNQL